MKSFKMLFAMMVLTLSVQASAELVRIPDNAQIKNFLERPVVIIVNKSLASVPYEYKDVSYINFSNSLTAVFYSTEGKKVTLQAGSRLTIKVADNAIYSDYIISNITLKNSEKHDPRLFLDKNFKYKTWLQLRNETQGKIEFYVDETPSELVF